MYWSGTGRRAANKETYEAGAAETEMDRPAAMRTRVVKRVENIVKMVQVGESGRVVLGG